MTPLTPAELDAFLTHLQPGSAAPGADWERTLNVALVATAQQWPTLFARLPREAFLAHLARFAHPAEVTPAASASLYLAWACGQGDAEALEFFERDIFQVVREELSRVGLPTSVAEDMEQTLRARLLVGEEDRPPRILEYAGTGELRGWVRIAAARMALNHVTRAPPETGASERTLEALATAHADPELVYLKGLYAAEFREVFPLAMAALSSRERNLLRYRFLDGLNVDRIGAIYGVHRATAARQVAAAEQRLLEQLSRALCERLNLSGSDVREIYDLVKSQFDLSLRELMLSKP